MRQFYGRLETCVLSAGKNHVHEIPRFRGGGILGFWGGGGECRFYFYGRADFSESGCRKRSAAKGVRSLFFVLGTLSVTFRSLFLTLLSLFSSLFCQTPFAGLLLRQGEFTRTFFQKFAHIFAFFPVTRVRNPMEIAQKNLFKRICLFGVDFLGWIFLLRPLFGGRHLPAQYMTPRLNDLKNVLFS